MSKPKSLLSEPNPSVAAQFAFEDELRRLIAAHCPSKCDRWQVAHVLLKWSHTLRQDREPMTRAEEAEETLRRS